MPKRPDRETQKRIAKLRQLAKTNPQVDSKVVEQSIELVDFVRRLGFKGRGYNILGSSESSIKVKPPVLSKF